MMPRDLAENVTKPVLNVVKTLKTVPNVKENKTYKEPTVKLNVTQITTLRTENVTHVTKLVPPVPEVKTTNVSNVLRDYINTTENVLKHAQRTTILKKTLVLNAKKVVTDVKEEDSIPVPMVALNLYMNSTRNVSETVQKEPMLTKRTENVSDALAQLVYLLPNVLLAKPHTIYMPENVLNHAQVVTMVTPKPILVMIVTDLARTVSTKPAKDVTNVPQVNSYTITNVNLNVLMEPSKTKNLTNVTPVTVVVTNVMVDLPRIVPIVKKENT